MRIALVACVLLVALVCVAASASASTHTGVRAGHEHGAAAAAAPVGMAPRRDPRGRSRSVSKSSFHTDAGRVRDSFRAYEGEGTSHLRHFGKSAHAPANAVKAHLHDPAIHARLRGLIAGAMGEQHTSLVPSLENASAGVPEQVRVSLTARAGEMVVSWVTWNATASAVRLSLSPNATDAEVVRGDVFEWVDPNSLHLVRYMHNVLLTDLKASTQYFYRCGDADQNVWSPEFSFRSVGDGKEVMRIALYGDLGLVNSQSMEGLVNEVKKKSIDMAVSGHAAAAAAAAAQHSATGSGWLTSWSSRNFAHPATHSPIPALSWCGACATGGATPRSTWATGRTTWTSCKD